MCFKEKTIAIIDSGLGGVSVLKQLIDKFGGGNYIYYADNLNMPYGNKKKRFIQERINKIINLLFHEYKVGLIIIACNTASTCLFNHTYKNVHIMQFDANKVYLTTKLTKKNLLGFKTISGLNLASYIEKHLLDENRMWKYIKQFIANTKLDREKEVVLGCTHYELALKYFKKNAQSTSFICNSIYIVNKINIPQQNILNVHLIMSKYSNKFYNNFNKVLTN